MAAYTRFILSIAFLSIFHHVQSFARIDPLVETTVGLIRGLRASPRDGNYSMFLGIPFATVDPENPFGPSKPHAKFNHTYDAYNDTIICPQRDTFSNVISGSLDCLNLNVYVPNSASYSNRLPILVWIYGGGYYEGSAGRYIYGPKYLVRHDVILVTINYRVGPYGFMCLDTPEVPGNQGLKDQLLALRWINTNIEAFGGDKTKITLFGESAGARSTDFHLHSLQEKLFNSVILQSGSAVYPEYVKEADRTAPIKLAEKLDFETDDFNEALSFLKTVDTALVIEASLEIERFFPCIEKDFEDVESFILDYAVNQRVPKVTNVPILLGVNNNEMLSTYGNKDEAYFRTINEFNTRLTANFNFDDNDLAKLEEIIKHFYIADESLNKTVKWEITDFASDIVYNHPAERSIARYLENNASNIYFYLFSYKGRRNFYKRRYNITIGGAAHSDELGYLFDVSFWRGLPSRNDQRIIDQMTSMWTNFVKYGNPTPEITKLLPIKWKPIVKDSPYYYLDINYKLSMKKRPFNYRMAFWDLFYKTNWKNQKGFMDDTTFGVLS